MLVYYNAISFFLKFLIYALTARHNLFFFWSFKFQGVAPWFYYFKMQFPQKYYLGMITSISRYVYLAGCSLVVSS